MNANIMKTQNFSEIKIIGLKVSTIFSLDQ